MLGDNTPAELARIATAIETNGGMATGVQVRHLRGPQAEERIGLDGAVDGGEVEVYGGPGGADRLHRDLGLSGRPALTPDWILEEFRFSLGGCSFQTSTGPVTLRPSVSGRFDSGRMRILDAGRCFSGVLPANPGFVYQNSVTTEVLIGFGRDWNPTLRNSVILLDILLELASAAVDEAGAPILFLQSPVASPPAWPGGDGSNESQRAAQSNSVRMSVAIPNGDDRARLSFLSRVERSCGSRGLSLHIADLRGGRARGEWFEVRDFDSASFEKYGLERYGSIPEDPIDRVVMVTVVGPARSGSTWAVLRKLRGLGAGVVGGAVSSLSETALINFIIPVSPDLAEGHVASTGWQERDAMTGLQALHRLCGLTGDQSEVSVEGADRLLGYRVLRSEPLSLQGLSLPIQERHPIWVAWDLPAENGRIAAVEEYLRAPILRYASGFEIVYARTRVTSFGRIRGRAKISILLHSEVRPKGIPAALREIAELVEQEATSELVRILEPTAQRALRVTARERWIGRVSLPL